jgi:hypothetical protein
MNSQETLTLATSLPVQVNPSTSEIVFDPDSNSYALSIGVKVQLPISDLVEVLLKFNQEQIASNSKPQEMPAFQRTKTWASALPRSTTFTFDPPVAHAESPRHEHSTSFAVDTPTKSPFDQIPMSVVRQDIGLFDYRERSKWARDSGRFFIENWNDRESTRFMKQEEAFRAYDNLPINDAFLADFHQYEDVPMTTDFFQPLTKLSADAPVFTPASAFASTVAAAPTDASMRLRAMSDSATRNERSMSSMTYLPPSVVEATEADNEQSHHHEGCKQM